MRTFITHRLLTRVLWELTVYCKMHGAGNFTVMCSLLVKIFLGNLH